MNKVIFFLFSLILSMSIFSQSQSISNQKVIGTNTLDVGLLTIKLSDGSYILTCTTLGGVSGNKTTPSYGNTDVWIMKLDASMNILWQKSFGGSGDDACFSMIETSEGDFLIGGSTNSPISGNQTVGTSGLNDYWLIKLDANGNLIWQKQYGGTDNDKLEEIIEISPTKYLCTGTSNSSISGDKTENSRGSNDSWTLMIDSSGLVLWDKTIGGDLEDLAIDALYFQQSGEIIVVCESNSTASGDKTENSFGIQDAWILKLDTMGVILSQKTIGGDDFDTGGNLIQKGSNDFIFYGQSYSGISGNKTSPVFGNSDAWVVKMDLNLSILSDNTYGGASYEGFSKELLCSDGQILLYGGTLSSLSGDIIETNQGISDCWIMSMNSSGNVNWNELIGGSNFDVIIDIYEISDNNYKVFASSESGISGDKTVANYGQSDIWIYDLSTTLNIADNNKKLFSVYPNPIIGGNELHVTQDNGNYNLLDAQGRIIQFGRIENNIIESINVINGFYTLQIFSDEMVSSVRLIVE